MERDDAARSLRAVNEPKSPVVRMVGLARTYLHGPAVCCKPDVSDGGIGLALLYPARE